MTRNLTHRCFWTFLGDWGWLEFTFTENSKKLVTEWVIISGPQLLAQLKVGPIIVGFFLTTHCCHDRWLIGIKGEGLALCETWFQPKMRHKMIKRSEYLTSLHTPYVTFWVAIRIQEISGILRADGFLCIFIGFQPKSTVWRFVFHLRPYWS